MLRFTLIRDLPKIILVIDYNDMKNDDPWDADNQTHSKYTEYDWLNVTGVMSTDPETLYTKVTIDIFEAP